MKTCVTDDIELAAHWLRQGKLVAFPTETVYGLGADANSQPAIENLFAAKGRPSDNPLIVHVGHISQWMRAASSMTDSAKMLLEAFSPGPITVILPKQRSISPLVTAGLDTVGLRIPQSPQAQELLKQCHCPIAAPSANLSGRPSCTTWQAVLDDLDGRIDFVLRGEVCDVGIESTVVDCTGKVPIILRPGQITLEQIQQILPETKPVSSMSEFEVCKASPGTRHPHYQPRARVVLIELVSEIERFNPSEKQASTLATWGEMIPTNTSFLYHCHFPNLEEYMQGFYEFLRHSDRLHAKTVFMQLANGDRAAGLRDRQERAAAIR